MPVIFHHAAHRNFQPQFLQNLQRNIHLPAAAIHHDDIRENIKFTIFAFTLLGKTTPKSSSQHFFQAGIIVGTFHGFNFKPAILVFFRFSIDKYHHRRYALCALRIGNIITFHPGRRIFQPKQLLKLLQHADGPLLPDCFLQFLFCKRLRCIFSY